MKAPDDPGADLAGAAAAGATREPGDGGSSKEANDAGVDGAAAPGIDGAAAEPHAHLEKKRKTFFEDEGASWWMDQGSLIPAVIFAF